MSTARFYDGLAATYHALYPDWEREVHDQARALSRVLGHPPPGSAIADVACGIGTQLLGLAECGYDVFGSDLSPAAVHRAGAECRKRGLVARLVVADMRALAWPDASMDAAVCADNAIPHLLTDDEVTSAFAELRRVLRPGARVAVTIRDYDAALRERPLSTSPQVMEAPGHRPIISFQLWTWHGAGDIYDLEHFQLTPGGDGEWTTTRRTATYRAYTRGHLLELAIRAGLVRPRWLAPRRAGYFQPVLVAARAGTDTRDALSHRRTLSSPEVRPADGSLGPEAANERRGLRGRLERHEVGGIRDDGTSPVRHEAGSGLGLRPGEPGVVASGDQQGRGRDRGQEAGQVLPPQ